MILDEIVDYLDYATRYERYIVSRCPFHDDANPSFFVYADWYRCESCGKQGKSTSLLNKLSNKIQKPTRQTGYFQNPWTGWLKNESLSEVLKSSWETNNLRPSRYMRDRGISAENQRKYGIGQRDNWITFPIRQADGRIVGAVARTLSSGKFNKYVLPKNQDPNLFYAPSWKQITQSRELFLTFGIVDALSLSLMGVGAISTTTGKRIAPSSLDQFRKIIYIIPDQGEEEAGNMLASKLGWRGKVMRVYWPEDSKDVNDLLVNHPERLKEAVNEYLV